MKNQIVLEKPLFITIVTAVIITGGLAITSLRSSSICTSVNSQGPGQGQALTPTHISAILYYATTRMAIQQSIPEIKVVLDALQAIAPCNLLVFGMGHDSLMWSSFNPRGTTLFLEDEMSLAQKILKDAPTMRVHHVAYDTHLSEADSLLASYKTIPQCLPPQVYLKGNTRCKLALSELPEEVYMREWDAILIDGPRGYYEEAPGRMAVIFSAAVMARGRQRPGDTHVFLHDTNRKVEKAFAEEFLCRKYLVRADNRLWHFKIPPSVKFSPTFC